MQKLTSILLIVLIFSACGNRQPKIDYTNRTKSDSMTIDSIAADTTRILVAELPVYFDSTDYLMHPVGFVSINQGSGKKLLSIKSSSRSDYSGNNLSIDSYHRDKFSCNINNLIFENLKTGNKALLTKKAIIITDIQYLRALSNKTNQHYILYSVIDKDLNQDGELNHSDITSMFISNLDGTNFSKLTQDYHEYKDGKMIIQDLKYYFKTIEDINRDGELNKVDVYHYYYIDFVNSTYKVVEYNPLEIIGK